MPVRGDRAFPPRRELSGWLRVSTAGAARRGMVGSDGLISPSLGVWPPGSLGRFLHSYGVFGLASEVAKEHTLSKSPSSCEFAALEVPPIVACCVPCFFSNRLVQSLL